jgi:hypothetical protein
VVGLMMWPARHAVLPWFISILSPRRQAFLPSIRTSNEWRLQVAPS